MNARQKKFVDNYLTSGNIYQSAIDAGYSETYARGRSYELLENECIHKYIQEVNHVLDNEKIADMREVKEFWTSVVRDDHEELTHRLKASEYIAKTNAAFVERVEQSGDIGLNIEWVGIDETE